MPWTFHDIPDQTGRTAVVTGANAGIGFETARMLALKGATVVLACRSEERGRAAVRRIEDENPLGSVVLSLLDLADLENVAAFASTFAETHPRLDLLINNAGVMVPPLGRTKQGFELQFGVNHLGHVALTARLLPRLLATEGARVVVVSSGAQRLGRIDFDDLNWERRPYRAWPAYGQSKLANMLFALELSRRLAAAGASQKAMAAHPGWTATELQRTAPLPRLLNPVFAMKPTEGALPTLRAATDRAAENGSYWGPAHLFELFGPPVVAEVLPMAKDDAVAARLWNESEHLAGVSFPLPTPPTSVT